MAIHSKDAIFSVEDSAGTTLRALTSDLTNVTFSRQNDTHDQTVLGATAHDFIAGLTNGTIGLEGFWNKAATTGSATVLDSLLALIGTQLDWEYGPEGGTATDVKYTGKCILESLDYTAPVADLVTFSATLRLCGAVTKGAYS